MSTPRPRVLAVDDENDILLILRTCLRDDYDVVAATSGPEALQLAEESPPDILLLDLMLPGMDGLELLDKLRAIDGLENTPVIFLTGVSDKEKLREALGKGIQYYIMKPFMPNELTEKVRQALHASGIGPVEAE